jgi:hypothetical protein
MPWVSLDHDPLDLIGRDLIVASIIKTRRARSLMIGHLLGISSLPPLRKYSVTYPGLILGRPNLTSTHSGQCHRKNTTLDNGQL